MFESNFKPLKKLMGYQYNIEKFDKAILAIGSMEFHGEHLPYGTDTLVADHLAREIASRVKGLLMLPTLPIGMSAHYSSFPIAITLKTETLMHVLFDIFESLRKHNLEHLIIINGHDGNISAIEAATREYRTNHPEFKIAVLEAWWMTAKQLIPENTFEVWDGLGHGGEGETSMMLRVAPNLVDMKKTKGVIPNLPEYIQLKWIFNELTPYGVTGDPSKATPEKGKLMNDALVKHLVDFIKDMDEKNWQIGKVVE
jgi:creatinine amidohydrolase